MSSKKGRAKPAKTTAAKRKAGTRRTAYYTNLPPGRYRFHVTAANADGVWSTEGANVEFGLRPHFYQTGWFYALCAAVALALALELYLLRVRRMRQQFALVLAERTRVAREMHDTLIQGVVGASAVLEAVRGCCRRPLPRPTATLSGHATNFAKAWTTRAGPCGIYATRRRKRKTSRRRSAERWSVSPRTRRRR